MTSYSISSFGTGLIGKLAQQINDYKYGDHNEKLNGNEISLFSEELSKKGVSFDFSKVNDSNYIAEVEAQYKKGIDKAYEQNARAEEIIEENKENYTIKRIYNQNLDGSYTAFYEITAKVDVNLAKLKDDLDIRKGVISQYNTGYGQWDNDGHHIDNKAMKEVTIKIPANELGGDPDISDKIGDALKKLAFAIFG